MSKLEVLELLRDVFREEYAYLQLKTDPDTSEIFNSTRRIMQDIEQRISQTLLKDSEHGGNG